MAENIDEPSFVVDASYVLAYLLPDETNTFVDKTFIAHEHGEIRCVSTALLPFEVGNSLRIAVMRKRIKENVAKQLLIQFVDLDVLTYPIVIGKAFDLAMQNNLTVYDASYLWLSKNKKLPLLTLDAELKKFVQKNEYLILKSKKLKMQSNVENKTPLDFSLRRKRN